ncbi:MAG TPA: four helix bundle protein [Thermoguttaceae bacterium]
MDKRNFRNLLVWQLGIQLAEDVYRLSEKLPKNESYGLCSQIQRAAVSIPANIAEGHARGSSKDFIRYLAIAQGSLAELETHLIIAKRMQYGDSVTINSILDRCAREARMLRSLRKSIKSRISNQSNPQSPIPNP